MNRSAQTTPVGTLSFFGGAGTVTGSKFLVRAAGRHILLDCGLFQGLKELRLRNWQAPAFDPRHLETIVLSHAHLDHCGYLPVLIRLGFRGHILCTAGTADLLRIVLLDSARLQEEDAAAANREGYSKHTPALPLYTTDDAQRTLQRVIVHAYDRPVLLSDQVRVTFHRAGHILGAAVIELEIGHEPVFRLVFSGDLGRIDQPILKDPAPLEAADVLLLESTYGDRTHPEHPEDELVAILHEAIERGGAIIVPSFAIGRTQSLIWWLRELERHGKIPVLPVFLDSPMAVEASAVYERHRDDHDPQMRAILEQEHTLRSQKLQILRTPEQSKILNRYDGQYLVISASGMATGGRVLYHLRAHLPDPKATVLLIGYQAAGTRGRALREGATSIKIHGIEVPVRAAIRSLDGLSAHADRDELLAWVAGCPKPPKQIYLVHGEPQQAASLEQAIRERFGYSVAVAQDGQTVPLALS